MRKVRTGFAVGLGLATMAFVAAAADNVLGQGGLINPAHDLWHAISPATLVTTEIRITRSLGVGAWEVLRAVLAVPAWLILGIPAGFLLWRYRPVSDGDIREQEHSLATYDRLLRAAEEEGYTEDDPPRWVDFPDHDPDPDQPPHPGEFTPEEHLRRYVRDWTPPTPGPDELPDGSEGIEDEDGGEGRKN